LKHLQWIVNTGLSSKLKTLAVSCFAPLGGGVEPSSCDSFGDIRGSNIVTMKNREVIFRQSRGRPRLILRLPSVQNTFVCYYKGLYYNLIQFFYRDLLDCFVALVMTNFVKTGKTYYIRQRKLVAA